MNRFAKDVLVFSVRNSKLVTSFEDDDHAMIRLDYLLRSVRSIGFDAAAAAAAKRAVPDDNARGAKATAKGKRAVPMNKDDEVHAATAKAKAHDMITAPGYKAILKSRLQFNSALNADQSPWTPHEPDSINYNASGDEVLDGNGHVTVRIHKYQPSTIFEHLRDSLAHLETRPELYKIPGTEIFRPAIVKSTDGGADEHPTGIRQLLSSAILIISSSATFYIHFCRAAGFSPLGKVERLNTAETSTLNNCIIRSDTFGKVSHDANGIAINSSHESLERRNLGHAQDVLVGLLACGTAFGRTIDATKPPSPATASFSTVKETEMQRFVDGGGSGGCSCGKGTLGPGVCTGASCRSCVAQHRQCTFRCKCKGRCANGHRPSSRDVRPQLLGLFGKELALAMSPAELEIWCHVHLRVGTYWVQCLLPCSSPACWYCTGPGMRARLAELDDMNVPRFELLIPPMPNVDSEALEFIPLEERQAAARDGRMSSDHATAALSGSFVPSRQIAASFKTAAAATAAERQRISAASLGATATAAVPPPVRPSPGAMAALVRLTFLDEATIKHHFDKLSGELKAAAARAGDAEAEPSTPDAIAFHSDPAAYARDRGSLMQRLAAQDPALLPPAGRPA